MRACPLRMTEGVLHRDSETGQHHDRRPGPGTDYGLRPGETLPKTPNRARSPVPRHTWLPNNSPEARVHDSKRSVFTGPHSLRIVHRRSGPQVGTSIPELLRAHEESLRCYNRRNLLTTWTPVVERVILRCLEHDRTPAAEIGSRSRRRHFRVEIRWRRLWPRGKRHRRKLVAVAGETGSLSLQTGILCLVSVLLGLFTFVALAPFNPLLQFEGLNSDAQKTRLA